METKARLVLLFGAFICLTGVFLIITACTKEPPEPDKTTDENVTLTDSSRFIIDSKGGEFLLPSGIMVSIPEGAVNESKEIKVDNLMPEDAQALDTIITSDDSPFLFGITITTDEFNFEKAIKVRIPVQDLDENGLPVLYELQGENKKWLFSDETIMVSNEENYVEIILEESAKDK